MTGRSFYHDSLSPESALRLALSHMATASGKDHRMIAAELDMSPSQFSRAITTTPHDDSHQRAHFPPEKIALYTERSQCLSYFMTLADYVGVDSSKLHTILRATKTALQVEEEKVERLKAIQAELTLLVQEAGARKGKR